MEEIDFKKIQIGQFIRFEIDRGNEYKTVIQGIIKDLYKPEDAPRLNIGGPDFSVNNLMQGITEGKINIFVSESISSENFSSGKGPMYSCVLRTDLGEITVEFPGKTKFSTLK